MTDPTPTTFDTDAEREANARRINAEADKHAAEARKLAAEADTAEASAESRRIALADELDDVAETKAKDDHHRLYRFSGDVTKASVDKAIARLTVWHRIDPKCDIEIIFASPGGEIPAGFQLFDYIRDLSANGHHVTTGCTGMAASMAGILVQAGDTRWMHAEAWYMLHRAAFGAAGQTFEIEDRTEWVKRIEKRIIDIFVARSSLTARRIKNKWDRKDWWIDSDQALEFGLVDEVRGQLPDTEGTDDD